MAAPKGNNYSALRKQNKTYTDEEIDEMCDKLLDWANNSDGLYIASFVYENYKKSTGWIYNLSEHHPELKSVLAMVKELTAAKVVRHSWIGDRNSTFGEKILPMFSPEYKALLEWKAAINKENLKSENIAAVNEILKSIANSDKKSD